MRMPEPVPHIQEGLARFETGFNQGNAHGSGGMGPRSKGHPRIDLDNEIITAGLKFPPSGFDDDSVGDASDKEKFLPRLCPVLLIHLFRGDGHRNA